jgi:hypothetical protein
LADIAAAHRGGENRGLAVDPHRADSATGQITVRAWRVLLVMGPELYSVESGLAKVQSAAPFFSTHALWVAKAVRPESRPAASVQRIEAILVLFMAASQKVLFELTAESE